ncbi:MAG: phospholipid carrier-dependent glycosyltransferase [Proteobacteria bacterium]|nr:phospholipid carrier-dependent glycosyltransferase [Pseudomonadota bacterium]
MTSRFRTSTVASVAGILFVIIVATVIRLWGVSWGLPYTYHADEPVNLTRTLDMLQRRSVDPEFYNYPPFFYYVEAGGQLAYYGVGSLTGEFSSIDDISLPEPQTLANGRLGNPNSLLAGRMISLALGIGAVGIVFVSIMAVTGSMSGAVVGSLLLALGPLAVRQTRFMTPDGLATFFVAAVLALSFFIYRRSRMLHYVLAGIAIGLAGSSKYHVAVVAVAVVVAHVMRTRTRFYRDPKIYIAGAIALGTFLATSFVIFFDLAAFWAEFAWKQGAYSGSGGSGAESLWFYLQVVGAEAGPLLLLIPFGFLMLRTRGETIIAVAFAVVYLLVIALFVLRFERHVLPALPAIAMGVGFGVTGLLDVLRAWMSDRPPVEGQLIVGTAMLGLLVAASVPLTSTFSDGQRYSSDERADARTFVNSLPVGSRILVDGYSPFVDPGRFDVVPTGFVVTDTSDPRQYDYVTVAELGSGRFTDDPATYPIQASRFDERFASFCTVGFFAGPPWQMVLAAECPEG